MIDKRPCYTMETGYTSSDFSFYRRSLDSLDVGRSQVYDLQSRAGQEKWYLEDTYTWRGNFTSETVLVLTNDNGVQIETASFGWRRIPTEHELALKEKTQYNNFYAALAECGKLCPAGASRWFNEAVLENFDNEFEEILYYGDDDA